jgi:hypothetical protein
MRKIFSLLLMVCSPAFAGIFAVGQTETGIVVLTDVHCESKKSYVAYTVNKKNETNFGCWLADDVMVHVFWDQTVIKSYPHNIFKLMPEKKDKGSFDRS